MVKKEKHIGIIQCRECGSTNTKKNGYNCSGRLQYYCKDCKASKVLNPKNKYTKGEIKAILRAYNEKMSMRAINRVFGISPMTLTRWIKKKQK